MRNEDAVRELRHRNRSKSASLFVGCFMTGFGVLLFLQNLGVLRIRDIFAWIIPIIAVGWGLYTIIRIRSPFSWVFGGLAISFGVFRILDVVGVIDFDRRYIPPFILMGVGGALLARALQSPKSPGSGPYTDDYISQQSVFGGVERRVDSTNFRGGDMFAMFGGFDFDFRHATIPPGEIATIDVHCMFGGGALRVPEHWRVDVRTLNVFGGVEDKSVGNSGDATKPLLVITGNVIFGGLEIKN